MQLLTSYPFSFFKILKQISQVIALKAYLKCLMMTGKRITQIKIILLYVMPILTIQNLKSLEETDWIVENRGATISSGEDIYKLTCVTVEI